jgi:phage recombination protein Bet
MNQIASNRQLTTAVKFNNMRLPYMEEFAELGVDNIRWKVLIDTIYPSAQSIDSIAMALSYCRARNLDIFKKPVHIVPMYSRAAGGMVETIWPGISELRTTAARTGEYAGCEAAVFGPTIKRAFTGMSEVWENRKKIEKEITVNVEFAEWCQLTVTRLVKGRECKFVSPKVFWMEAYARLGYSSELPNDMWRKRTFSQHEKCTEAAALRRAFPEEIGNEYAAEEMEGQVLFAEREAAPIKLDKPANGATGKPKGMPNPNKPASAPPQAKQAATGPIDFDVFRKALDAAETQEAANVIYEREATNRQPPLTDEELDECDALLRESCARFWKDEE